MGRLRERDPLVDVFRRPRAPVQAAGVRGGRAAAGTATSRAITGTTSGLAHGTGVQNVVDRAAEPLSR